MGPLANGALCFTTPKHNDKSGTDYMFVVHLFLTGLLWGHGSGLESVLCGWVEGGGGVKQYKLHVRMGK